MTVTLGILVISLAIGFQAISVIIILLNRLSDILMGKETADLNYREVLLKMPDYIENIIVSNNLY